tara:strand:- start:816 stop:1799 length:984 start_codon:yes stop_codon:yes gene_type:complete
MMHYISGEEIASILTYPKCIELMRKAMETVARGDSVLPLRQAMPLPDSDNKLGVMPGYLGGDDRAFGVKLLSLFPDNPNAGFPSHMGLYTLFDAEHGEPLAIMSANVLTAIRTACMTAAATDILARKDAKTMLIVGTGEQAESHVHALCEVRQFEEIRIWGRSLEKAQVLAARLQSATPVKLTAVGDLSAATKGADIITAVTASPTPLLDKSCLEAGMHVNSVGASHRGVMEIAPDMLATSRFVVDHLPAALDQAGEMLAALDQAIISGVDMAAEIGDVFLGKEKGRTTDQDVTIYKSLGIAAQDISAAKYILSEAKARGLGTELSL